MPELQQLFSRHRKYILYLLSMYVLGWGFTPYQSIFLGLILGTSIGLFNQWILVRRTSLLGESFETGRKARPLGTLQRMAAAVLAVLISTRYPETFHFLSVIIGLMTPYAVIMIDFVYLHFKTQK